MTPAFRPGPESLAPFRRLLLVLDAMSGFAASAEAAARLARRFEAEFAALYVESEEILRLAGHPGARLVATKPESETERKKIAGVDPEMLARALRARAEEVRRAVERAARGSEVNASFEVRRGRIAAEVASRASDSDLVIVAWAERSAWPGPISTARAAEAIARANPGSILFLREDRALTGPVVVAFDGTDAAERALEAGAAIAGTAGNPCEVILKTAKIAEAERWRNEIEKRLAAMGVEMEFLHLPGGGRDEFCAAAHRRGAALVVVGASAREDTTRAGELLDRLSCSLLLVR
ncbi:MAG: universal stress protein [Rhodospirillales bacterium]|nr:universal stress protein [Rhodospirillales bacterium]